MINLRLGNELGLVNRFMQTLRIISTICLGFIHVVLLGCASLAPEVEALNPLVDYRATGQVHRNPNGSTQRSQQVLVAFRKAYLCPSTKQSTGACPGWAIDHVIPLACGGVDAVYNLQWLPDQIKSGRGKYSKDHFERVVYGGQGMSKGCP